MIEEQIRTVEETASSRLAEKLRPNKTQYTNIQALVRDVLTEEINLFREKVRESLYGFDSQKGIRDVIDYVTLHYMVSFDEIQSQSRKQHLAEPRQIIHWMLRNHVVFNRLSLKAVGELVGARDHATVLHSVKAINNFIATDHSFRERIMVMCNELGARVTWYQDRKELIVTGYLKRNNEA